MYSLNTPLRFVKGVGPARAQLLDQAGLKVVADILLTLPLRYEDRSQVLKINQLPINQTISVSATVIKVKESFARKRFVSAVLKDETGSLNALWFNNKFVAKQLKIGETYIFSGKVSVKGSLIQPQFESGFLAEDERIHTSRLVPLYSSTLPLASSAWRRLLKEITDHLDKTGLQKEDLLYQTSLRQKTPCLPIQETLPTLHFPSSETTVIEARERLALEELIQLIQHSQNLQEQWQKQKTVFRLPKISPEQIIHENLPFQLTQAQNRCINEILDDLQQKKPMNRLLMGDVGSGKTIVAGIVAQHLLNHGINVALVAPTRILAEQHIASLQKSLPNLKTELVTASSNHSLKKSPKSSSKQLTQPTLFIGTHAILNKLNQAQVGLLIYDEQHRFGVSQRSLAGELKKQPHLLTMTATPIPRTLLLSIFSHLNVSHLDELPANRLPTKTWLLTENKRLKLYDWLTQQIQTAKDSPFQAIFVCPFINASQAEGFDHVKAAEPLYKELRKQFSKKIKIALLHGQQKKQEQQEIIADLRNHQLDILVTTTIVEVGVDLPQASLIVIESAERYGLASLHQLRGRVGRAGQQGYCALFTSEKISPHARLKQFPRINNGQELAELDLKNRGAGDLFGFTQTGFDELKFASWTNLTLIQQAKNLGESLPKDWQSILPRRKESQTANILSN